MTEKIYQLMGLCMRAGKLLSGSDACLSSVRAGAACLVIVDAAASSNTRKQMQDACSFRNVPFLIAEEGRLGDAVGRPGRMVAVVTDRGFAQAMIKAFPGQ